MLPAVANGSSSVAHHISSLVATIGKNPQIVGAAWFASSAIFTTYSTNKYLQYASANDAPAAKRTATFHSLGGPSMTPSNALTLWRFFGSLLLGLVLSTDVNVWGRMEQTFQLSSSFALPAMFLFIANLFNAIALERIGISLTYTSKCGIPLITVLLTAILDGISSLPSNTSLVCLIPIALGIAAASWSSPAFETFGFLAALVSTTSQSCLNVVSKRAILKTGVSGSAAQRSMVAMGLIFAVTSNTFLPRKNHINKDTTARRPPWLTASAILAYHIEYVLSFSFVRLVQPVTYGCSDAVRRLAIILSGRCMFGSETPLTRLNIAGIALALMGALGYSIASAVVR